MSILSQIIDILRYCNYSTRDLALAIGIAPKELFFLLDGQPIDPKALTKIEKYLSNQPYKK